VGYTLYIRLRKKKHPLIPFCAERAKGDALSVSFLATLLSHPFYIFFFISHGLFFTSELNLPFKERKN